MQIYEQKQRETTPPISLKKSHKDNNNFFFHSVEIKRMY